MKITVEQVVSEALELPLSARAFIAEKIIESLDTAAATELSPQWKKEIRKRCKEVEQGIVQLSDAESVFKKAYAMLG